MNSPYEIIWSVTYTTHFLNRPSSATITYFFKHKEKADQVASDLKSKAHNSNIQINRELLWVNTPSYI